MTDCQVNQIGMICNMDVTTTIPALAYPYSGLLSNIGNTARFLNADDDYTPSNSRYSRITIKCRTLGTNTYLAYGNTIRQDQRFTKINQSYTFKAPTINGKLVPLRISDIAVIGDVASGAGVIEISGIRVVE